VDHRVEPPSWLPQGAAPKAADPEVDEAPASDDAHALQDDAAPADSTAEEFSNGNGHDGGPYSYARDDSYTYVRDSSYAARGPFEESTKPPFNELPGAGYEQAPVPPPPGDELGGNSFSSGVTVGAPEKGFGGDEATELVDDGYRSGDDAYSSGGDDGYRSSGDGGYRDSGAGAALADGGFGASVAGAPPLPDAGPATGDTYASSPYAPPFEESTTVVPEAARPDMGRTGVYAYPPPTAASPPQPVAPSVVAQAKGRKSSSGARKANLIVARLEPWSVMKFSFLISLVAWIVLFVAVALLYYALSSIGVFASLQKTLASVTSSQGSAGVDLTKWTSGTRVLGYTMLIGAVDVVLITALSTLGAVVYNLVTHLGGGIEITLKETE